MSSDRENRVILISRSNSKDRACGGVTRLEMVDQKQRNALNELAETKRNESHVSDFHYAVQISICLLKPIGAWPLASETSWIKIILHKALMVISMFLQIFLLVPWIMVIVKDKWSVYLIFRSICSLLFVVTIFVRYVLLLWHQDQLRLCVEHVADDWRCAIIAEDRDIMLANAQVGRIFGIVSVAFMFSCGILFYAIPIATPNLINEYNVTVRQHPAPCEFFVFDSQVKLPTPDLHGESGIDVRLFLICTQIFFIYF